MLWAHGGSHPSLANEPPPDQGLHGTLHHSGLGGPWLVPLCPPAHAQPMLGQCRLLLIAASASLIFICCCSCSPLSPRPSPSWRGEVPSAPAEEQGGFQQLDSPKALTLMVGTELPGCCHVQGHPGPSVHPQILIRGLVLCRTPWLMRATPR